VQLALVPLPAYECWRRWRITVETAQQYCTCAFKQQDGAKTTRNKVKQQKKGLTTTTTKKRVYKQQQQQETVGKQYQTQPYETVFQHM